MDDIVKRLRTGSRRIVLRELKDGSQIVTDIPPLGVMLEAADEIESLRARLAAYEPDEPLSREQEAEYQKALQDGIARTVETAPQHNALFKHLARKT